MIYSMTGFSSSIIAIEKKSKTGKISSRINLMMTLKTLNSRFFETTCKLPYALTHLETILIKKFKEKFHRGNVYFTIHAETPALLAAHIEPSLAIVADYIEAIKEIQKTYNIVGEISINSILSLPHVFENKEELIDEESSKEIISQVENLIDQLIQVRIEEGKILEKDLLKRIDIIKSYFNELEPRAKEVIIKKKEQLIETLKSLKLQSQEAETQNISIYNQLDKLDIHEELVRFAMHLNTLEKIIESENIEKGKKFDFTLQELFREINTIAAKCSDANISGLVINIKVELEKAREQVQNIV